MTSVNFCFSFSFVHFSLPLSACLLFLLFRLQEALRLGSPPCHRLSFALIEKLASERQYDKAERVIPADQPPYKRPAAYAECMLVYASHGMSGYAYELLERFHPDGVNNLAVYNALITIAGQEKRPAEVARLFTQVQERCGAISYGTVLALLEGYAAQGAWEEVPRVVQLFHEKCKREHGRLTQKAFALLFEALGRGGRLAEIAAWYAEMNEARVRKTLSCYSAVLLGLKGRLHHPDAHRVWEVLDGFRLPVHKVIRNILSDRKQEGSWDLSLQQALDRVPGGARESLLYKRGFFNALLDILWAESKCRHAANVVAVALRKGVYLPGRRALPLKPGVAAPGGSSTGQIEGGGLIPGDPPEWWVDLRHTSPGAACAILRGWLLGDAREGVANAEAGLAELPEKVRAKKLLFVRVLLLGRMAGALSYSRASIQTTLATATPLWRVDYVQRRYRAPKFSLFAAVNPPACEILNVFNGPELSILNFQSPSIAWLLIS